MTNNSIDNLDPIDRYFSEVLDVHTWSDHPEIKALTNLIYDELGCADLQSRSNNQGNISVKNMLRVLLLDLYVRWLTDPNLATAFHKHPRNYKPNSRYNALYINFYAPKRIERTDQYIARRDKFYKWKELKSE